VAGRRLLLPVIPLLAILLLSLVEPAQEIVQGATDPEQVQDQIRRSTEELRRRLAEHRQSTLDAPEEADELFRQLQQGLDELTRDESIDRQRALVKMNDLAQEVEKRRQALGDTEKMKQQFGRLKDIQQGPAEKMADALREGNLEKAIEELKSLSAKIQKGELTEQEREKLAEQLKQMQQKLEEMVESHEQAKEELKRQIAQKEAEGDMESAGRLQRQLDQLEKMDGQMARMQRMAAQLNEAEQSMAQGDPATTLAKLDQLASELEEMQADMDQLQTLNELMDEIASAKEGMANEGDRLSMTDGFGMDGFGDGQGDGRGDGQGAGYRPEQETETGEYQARERVKPQAGEAVRVGDAFGPNRAGMSQEEVKQLILSSLRGETDPLTDQRLPKSQKDHVRQYYQRMDEGQ
jgi:hypothetical protein